MAEVSERRDREVAPLVSVETVGKVLARPLLALNLFLAGISIFSSIRIGHALLTHDLQSPSRIARPPAAADPRHHGAVRNSRSGGVYDVIATRPLFHPNRSEPRSLVPIATILPPATIVER